MVQLWLAQKLHFILYWFVLRYIFWYGFLCVLAFEMYSLVSSILYLTCCISSIITSYSGARTCSWGC